MEPARSRDGGAPDPRTVATPTEPPVVLFVCRHGAAKSVLAAAALERIAGAMGIPIAGQAAGVEPDEDISAAVVALLPERAADLRRRRPRRVTSADVESASLTVTFNLDPSELPRAPVRALAWDDIPAVSDDPDAAREAIERHLVDLLGSESAPGRRPG